MAIGDDLEIQNDKDIRAVAGTANYTVLALHEWLRGLADDASAAGDDYMDMSRPTPADKQFDTIITLINGFNIDGATSQRLYGGSIIQAGGDVIYDGIQVLAPAGMYLDVIQNNALMSNFWTTGINADAANGISHQFILLVRTGGNDIDGRRLIGTTREFNKTYGEFKVNGTSRGVNVMAFTGWADDLNNSTAAATVATWTDVVNVTEGRNAIDVDADGTDEFYYSEWDKASRTINQMYERLKWLTRRGTSSSLYGLGGERFRGISHEIGFANAGGSFAEAASVGWTISGSSFKGQILAARNTGAACTLWIQLLTGTAPTASLVLTQGSISACQLGSASERTVATPFLGQSTGTAIIGAFGLGVEAADLAVNDKVFDLTNTQKSPPNNVTFTVGGLVASEDRVLVGPRGYRFFYDGETSGPFTVGETLRFGSTGTATAKLADLLDLGTTGEIYTGSLLTGSLLVDNDNVSGSTSGASALINGTVFNDANLRQFTTACLLNGAAVTSVEVDEAIDPDSPTTGTIRIKRTNGVYTRHPYSNINYGTKIFTITSHNFSSNTAPEGTQVFNSYLDLLCDATSEAFTVVYSSDRTLFIRVRDGGATPIKTFETTGTLGSAGGTSTAVRTSDA